MAYQAARRIVLPLTHSCFEWESGSRSATKFLFQRHKSLRSVDEKHVGLKIAHQRSSIDKLLVHSQTWRHGSDRWCPGKTARAPTTGDESPYRKLRRIWVNQQVTLFQVTFLGIYFDKKWELCMQTDQTGNHGDEVYHRVPLLSYSVHRRALFLCGWGINAPWWLHIVVSTRCLWTCRELNKLYVSVTFCCTKDWLPVCALTSCVKWFVRRRNFCFPAVILCN